METHESGGLYRSGRRAGLRRTPVATPVTTTPFTTTPVPVPLAQRRWLLPTAVGVLVVGVVAGAVLAGLGLPLGQGAQAAPAHPAETASASPVPYPSITADPSPTHALPPVGTLHAASSRCLDLEKPDNGGWATTTECDGSDRQRWQLHRAAGTDQYTIVNLAGDGCLDVENASRDDNARIVTWTCHDADNQRWLARGEGDTFTLANVYSGMCATAGDDGKLRQHACRADNGQRWTAEVPLPPDQSPSSSSAT